MFGFTPSQHAWFFELDYRSITSLPLHCCDPLRTVIPCLHLTHSTRSTHINAPQPVIPLCTVPSVFWLKLSFHLTLSVSLLCPYPHRYSLSAIPLPYPFYTHQHTTTRYSPFYTHHHTTPVIPLYTVPFVLWLKLLFHLILSVSLLWPYPHRFSLSTIQIPYSFYKHQHPTFCTSLIWSELSFHHILSSPYLPRHSLPAPQPPLYPFYTHNHTTLALCLYHTLCIVDRNYRPTNSFTYHYFDPIHIVNDFLLPHITTLHSSLIYTAHSFSTRIYPLSMLNNILLSQSSQLYHQQLTQPQHRTGNVRIPLPLASTTLHFPPQHLHTGHHNTLYFSSVTSFSRAIIPLTASALFWHSYIRDHA